MSETIGELLERRTHKMVFMSEINAQFNNDIDVGEVEPAIKKVAEFQWATEVRPHSSGYYSDGDSTRYLHLQIMTSSLDYETMIDHLKSLGVFAHVTPELKMVPINGIEALDLQESYHGNSNS